MTKEFISIIEAAELSQKSIQTIRRAIKAKKIVCRRKKTPQGFNYHINYQSLCEHFHVKAAAHSESTTPEKNVKKEHKTGAEKIYLTADDFASFTRNLEKVLMQHSEERQNYMRLISTMQEKIFFLENQVNLLKAPEKKWYQLWR